MSQSTPRTAFVALVASAAAATMALAALVIAPASATPAAAPTISSTSLGNWDDYYDGTYAPDNTVINKAARNLRSVIGNSTGTTGDSVDVYCVRKDAAHSALLASGAAVAADGAWSASFDMGTLYTDAFWGGCRLAAVWHGDARPAYDSLSSTDHYVVYAQPNRRSNDLVTDVWMEAVGPKGYLDWESISWCSLCDMGMQDPTTNRSQFDWPNQSNLLFYYNGGSEGMTDDVPGMLVDGKKVYQAMDINRRFPTVSLALRQHPVSYTLDKINGIVTYTETGELSSCSNESARIHEVSCKTFAGDMLDSGVALTRVTVVDLATLRYRFDDTFTSTDGNPHTVTTSYYEGNVSSETYMTDVKLPAEVSGATGGVWTDGNAMSSWTNVQGFNPGPTTVDFKIRKDDPTAWDNPVGSVIYTFTPDRIISTRAGRIMTFYDNRSLNAVTPLHFAAGYTMAASDEELATNKAWLRNWSLMEYPAVDVSWNPEKKVTTDTTSLSSLATAADGASIVYGVEDAGTTGCTIDPVTGAVTFLNDGTCVVDATASKLGFRDNRVEVELTVEPALKCLTPYVGKIEFGKNNAAISAASKKKLARLVALMVKARCGHIALTGTAGINADGLRSLSARDRLALNRANEVRRFIESRFALANRSTVVKVRSVAAHSATHRESTSLQQRMHRVVTIKATQ